jgi:hypothetical protein
MNLRHAAALVLAGWYLMLPPAQGMLDWRCSPGFVGRLLLRFSSEDTVTRAKRCAHEMFTPAKDAPLSEWVHGDQFQTQAECRAEQERVRKPLTGQQKAMQGEALASAPRLARLGITKDDLIRFLEQSRSLATCIPSDDPRLAK